MLFNSQVFVFAFLPAALAAWVMAARHARAREWVLVGVSLIFYGYWDVRFLPILVVTILGNWGLGLLRGRFPRFPVAAVGVPANLAVLAYFKYWNFFHQTLAEALGQGFSPSDILLPLGVSFFTFHHLSYLIDLQRGRAPVYGLRRYAVYITFFPHLIAGPIVRHNELIPQLEAPPIRPDLWRSVGQGAALFTLGLAKKVLLADRLAVHANAVFAAAKGGGVATMDAWTGVGSFALQIYFDFSAYTDMAIGLAMLFGFTLPENFRAPYRAASLREFWRRWHMTLSRFLRDYLYIPLGGNRHGPLVQSGALLATMALCGLWHGAGWTFILWGTLHGLGLVANSLWARLGGRMPALAGMALTLGFVVVAWVLFRAETMQAAWTLWTAMAGLGAEEAARIDGFKRTAFVAGWAVVLLLPPSQDVVAKWLPPARALGFVLGAGLAALVLELGKGSPVEFIYFAF